LLEVVVVKDITVLVIMELEQQVVEQMELVDTMLVVAHKQVVVETGDTDHKQDTHYTVDTQETEETLEAAEVVGLVVLVEHIIVIIIMVVVEVQDIC
jgi:hypothetical protein